MIALNDTHYTVPGSWVPVWPTGSKSHLNWHICFEG